MKSEIFTQEKLHNVIMRRSGQYIFWDETDERPAWCGDGCFIAFEKNGGDGEYRIRAESEDSGYKGLKWKIRDMSLFVAKLPREKRNENKRLGYEILKGGGQDRMRIWEIGDMDTGGALTIVEAARRFGDLTPDGFRLVKSGVERMEELGCAYLKGGQFNGAKSMVAYAGIIAEQVRDLDVIREVVSNDEMKNSEKLQTIKMLVEKSKVAKSAMDGLKYMIEQSGGGDKDAGMVRVLSDGDIKEILDKRKSANSEES